MTGSPAIYAIIGPTASGKSDLALGLARRIGAEILSVDSMQVYRHLNAATAKPTPNPHQIPAGPRSAACDSPQASGSARPQ